MNPTQSQASVAESGRRLLVVDDEAPIREVLKAYLEQHGFHVTTAASEAETSSLVSSQVFDLIILDILLEDGDGLDLLAKMKKRRLRCPVIIITGLGADDEVKRKAMERGAADCVSKTSPLDQLVAIVERLLTAAQQERAAAAAKASPSGKRRIHPAVSLKLPRSKAEPGDAPHTPDAALHPPEAVASEASTPADHAGSSSEMSQVPHPKSSEASDQKPSAPKVEPPKLVPIGPDAIARLITVTPEAAQFEFGMEVFLRMLSAFHANLGNTAMRAVVICKSIGEVLKLPAPQLQNLLWAAALHDIGLIQTERGLLNRWMRNPDKCTKEELALIRRLPERTQRMLDFCPALKDAGEIILAHHEHWDGSGYPSALKMEMIPWLSRLLSVVIHYCGRHSPDHRTVKEIETQANTLFDPQAVEALGQSIPMVTLPVGEREIPASALKPGMVLAMDLITWEGLMVLGKGKALDLSAITRILNLNQSGQIEARILVYC